MVIAALLLFGIGTIMLAKPSLVWHVTEQWKSNDAEEPSDFYRMSIRFGGAILVLAGIAAGFVPYLTAM